MRLTDPSESLMPMETVPTTAILPAEFSQPMRSTIAMGVGNVVKGQSRLVVRIEQMSCGSER